MTQEWASLSPLDDGMRLTPDWCKEGITMRENAGS
jgi:hypothetical protein